MAPHGLGYCFVRLWPISNIPSPRGIFLQFISWQCCVLFSVEVSNWSMMTETCWVILVIMDANRRSTFGTATGRLVATDAISNCRLYQCGEALIAKLRWDWKCYGGHGLQFESIRATWVPWRASRPVLLGPPLQQQQSGVWGLRPADVASCYVLTRSFLCPVDYFSR